MNAAAWFAGQSFCGRSTPPKYKWRQYGCVVPYYVDLELDVIRRVDADHAEPLRALEVGDEYEIAQVGAPPIFITRVS